MSGLPTPVNCSPRPSCRSPRWPNAPASSTRNTSVRCFERASAKPRRKCARRHARGAQSPAMWAAGDRRCATTLPGRIPLEHAVHDPARAARARTRSARGRAEYLLPNAIELSIISTMCGQRGSSAAGLRCISVDSLAIDRSDPNPTNIDRFSHCCTHLFRYTDYDGVSPRVRRIAVTHPVTVV